MMKIDSHLAMGLGDVIDSLPYAGDLNHMPRAAALLLLLDGDHAVHDDSHGVAVVIHELQQTTLSMLATRPNARLDAPRFELTHWPNSFYHAEDTKITLPAIQEPLIRACGEALRRLGRLVTFTEPCTNWEAPDTLWEQVCAEDVADVRKPLDWSALSASLGLPAGFLLCPLEPDDAPSLNAHWKYANGAATEAVIRECIASYPSVGIRRVADGASAGDNTNRSAGAGAAPRNSELVGWIVTRYDGSMGILQTLPAYRGKGFARATVKALMILQCRWLPTMRGEPPEACDPALPPLPPTLAVTDPASRAALARHVRPYCHIADYNTASVKLFEALGFQCTGRCSWLVSTRPAPRFVFCPLALSQGLVARIRARACVCPNHTGGVCSAPEPPGLPSVDPSSPWLAFEGPDVVSSAPQELLDLLSLIQRSYRQDDAFFVDQWRSCLRDVCDAAENGVFFLGYRQHAAVGDSDEKDGTGADSGASFDEGAKRFGLDTVAYPTAVPSSVVVAGCGDATVAMPPAAARHPFFAPTGELTVSVHMSFTEGDEGEAAAAAGAATGAPSSAGRTVHLSLLTIHPEYKKCGMASRVLDFALATARGTYGATAAEVHVVSVKPWLLDFYTRKGFAVVGEDPWPAPLQHQLLLPTRFHRCRKSLV